MPGFYAWGSTVLSPLLEPGAGLFARACGVAAPFPLLLGLALMKRGTAAGGLVALYGFVGLSVACWIALGPLIAVARLEPVQAMLGAGGWALFALGWGEVRQYREVPEDDPQVIEGPALSLRQRLPLSRGMILVTAIAGAGTCAALAWAVTRPAHALLAHALAVTCAVALTTAGSRLAANLPAEAARPEAGARVSAAAVPLACLGVLLGLGLIWSLFG
ncbi:MAG TPA: hypothetical protein VKZ49_01270 [Polyangiaceae bacterium]|nr:hypothetical protein [Polyangiaceae bacterium]